MTGRWSLLLAVALAVAAKLPTLDNTILFIDEPIYLTQAAGLDSVEAFIYSALYRVEPKFQLGLVPYVLALNIDRPNAMLVLHIFGLLATILSSWLILSISYRLFKNYLPGFLALTLWLLFLNLSYTTAATLLEYFQLPFLLLSVWLLAAYVDAGRRSLWLLVLSGLSVGMATLIKPPGLIMVVPLIVGLLLLGSWSWRGVFMLCVSSALPVVVFVLPYLFRPEALAVLRFSFVDVFFLYTTYTGDLPYALRAMDLMRYFGLDLVVFTVVSILALVWRTLAVVRSPDRVRTREDNFGLAMLTAGVVLFLAYATGLAKEHYLVAVVPFFLLFIGYGIIRILPQEASPKVQVTAVALIALVSVLSRMDTLRSYVGMLQREHDHYARLAPSLNAVELAQRIRQMTSEGDEIWVYYNAPEVYLLANRKPATTDPIGSWLTGQFKGFWIDKIYEELAEAMPRVMVGINEPRYAKPQAAPLMQIPRVADLLAEAYACDAQTLSYAVLCVRLDRH